MSTPNINRDGKRKPKKEKFVDCMCSYPDARRRITKTGDVWQCEHGRVFVVNKAATNFRPAEIEYLTPKRNPIRYRKAIHALLDAEKEAGE
ncbi:MAG TPA: hypothetical protein VGK43_00390 [Solirubrobacterales bacterium]